ncbi:MULTISPECIES: FimV/HubP family polar landmark protein [unclassified Pseudomonas]|uniref:FimV/HubP family polar landmark protein n=1 Tax=unclassified Pseudomonas TaxID=196821 RepID=UPI000BD65ADF|nr:MULTISPECIES: FimV/HubP family polar landmark protein [unclassified Pseudomonas]PVZ16188.1 pilus assembly protein FimV [Pseudomonas sp. URIL14HWK12:I12]PVZ25956.1 pilus assembly protein FimV [Pseudomonas sp. URIL14HWK12:I10]PVZ36520.1 pilus assembly protein FimV [Pseudomonas sp. URIL14HWK12:I11]SNZ13291.1 pilus assembly protein FimV [Pseudomonas sp. URIL14HWK12:I9]
MVHLRKLALAIAAASTLSSGLAQALELGEVTLKSAPNQPLLAEIELRDVGNLTAPEVVPSLASPEDFSKAGVNRAAYLSQLSFTPVINAQGRSVIQVTSASVLPDPMVKFLVQVVYPAGRLMRDYSVLVDPSKLSPQAPAATPAASAAPTPAVTTTGKNAQYTTKSPDTLWEIAARSRPAGASVQQTMLAIQALNPDAFLDSNINRLRAGQVLRLPDAPNATALGQPQAIAEVARQNAAWREGRRLGPRAQQVDATRRGAKGTAPATEPKDNLTLVSGDTRNGRGAAADQKALRDQLSTVQESLDSARRENDELNSRNADLQSQLDKLQRLIDLKNDQLARLQAAAAAPPAGQPAAPGAATPSQPAINAQLNEAPNTPASPGQDPAGAPSEGATGQAPATPDGQAAPGSSGAANAPATNTAPSASNPYVLGAAGGVALLAVLIAAWLLARRRKAQEQAEKHMRMARALEEEREFREEDFELPPTSFEGLDPQAPNVKLAPAMVAASAAAAQAAASGPAPFAPAPPPENDVPTVASLVKAPAADDVLTQAQDAIERGRYNHAADLLEPAVQAEPDRSELRLKLMEVYAHQGDRDAFVANERRLQASGANQASVESLKARFPAMVGVAAAAGLSAAAVAAEMDAQYVKDLLQDEPDAPEPIGEVFDTDFDLSLDGIDPATAEPAAKVESAPVNDLDFDALLRDTEAKRARELDLADFDLDVPAHDPAPSPVDALDDLEPEPAPVGTLPEDFDLSLADEHPEEQDRFAADLDEVNAQLGQFSQEMEQGSGGLDDFDFMAETDEVTTKLDLAKAYIEMQDADGARDILDEVLKEGNSAQQSEARRMLEQLA